MNPVRDLILERGKFKIKRLAEINLFKLYKDKSLTG